MMLSARAHQVDERAHRHDLRADLLDSRLWIPVSLPRAPCNNDFKILSAMPAQFRSVRFLANTTRHARAA